MTNARGRIDLVITTKNDHYIVIELKVIQLPYLELKGRSNIDKARRLEAMELDEVLDLTFKGDKFRSGTIHNWIDGETCDDSNSGSVRMQLQSYITGPTVQNEIVGKNFRALVAVIVGSRQIVVREMDKNGNWVSEFELANWIPTDRNRIPAGAVDTHSATVREPKGGKATKAHVRRGVRRRG